MRLALAMIPAFVLSSIAASAQVVFAPLPPDPTTVVGSFTFATGDFDEDGVADLFVPLFTKGQELVLPGVGDGSFGGGTPSAVFMPGGERHVGDIDADGHLDVISSDGFNMSYVRGAGDGSFVQGDTRAIAGGFGLLGSVELADVNGDGDLEIVLVKQSALGDTNDSVPVYDLNSALEFQLIGHVGSSPFVGTPGHVALADFDEDGKLDAVMTFDQSSITAPGAGVRLYLGNGAGSFPEPATLLAHIETSDSYGRIVSADFNLDGHADWAATDPDSKQLLVQLGDGSGGFSDAGSMPFTGLVSTLRADDLDGDGAPDLAVFSRGGVAPALPFEARIYNGVGDGTFEQNTSFTLSPVAGLFQGDLADIDGDGLSDLVSASVTGMAFDQDLGVAFNRTDVGGLPVLDLGAALAGSEGFPIQLTEGSFAGGTPITVDMFGAQPGAAVFQVLGFSAANQPVFGGTLVPAPDILRGQLTADGNGTVLQGGLVRPGIPSGFELYSQFWFQDAAGPVGWSATSAVRITFP